MAIKTTIYSFNLVFIPSTRALRGQTKQIRHVTHPKVACFLRIPSGRLLAHLQARTSKEEEKC